MPEANASLNLDVSGFNDSAREALTTMRALKNGIQSLATGMANLSSVVTSFNILASKNTWKEFAQGLRNVREWAGKLPPTFKAAAISLGVLVAAAWGAHRAFTALKNGVVALARSIQTNLVSAFRIGAVSAAVFLGAITAITTVLSRNIKLAIDFGAEMFDASKKAGVEGAGNFAILEKALVSAGMSAKDARKKIKEFSAEGRDFAELFESPLDFQIAMTNAAKALGSQADILNRSAQQFKAVQNSLITAGEKGRQFFLGLAEQVLPPLQSVLNYLNQLDLGEIGADFGKSITSAAEILIGLFKNGQIGEAFKLALLIGAKETLNVMAQGFQGIAEGFWETTKQGWSSIFGGLKDIFVGLGKMLAGSMISGLGQAIALINKMPDWVRSLLMQSSSGRVALALADSADKQETGIEKAGSALTEEGRAQGARGSAKWANIGKDMFEAFMRGFSDADQVTLFGTEEDRAEMRRIFEEAQKAGQMFIDANKGANVIPRLSDAAFNEEDALKKQREGKKSPFQVIADSLAAVGGGNGFAQISADVEEKQLEVQKKIQDLQKESVKTLERIYERLPANVGNIALA